MLRPSAILLIIITLSAAGYTLWTWRTAETVGADPWRAIPMQSAMVIEVPDAWNSWDRITHTTQLWRTFATAPGAAAAGSVLERLAARMENDGALRASLADQTVLVAILRSGGDRIGCLFVGVRNGGGALADQALAEVLGAPTQSLELLATGAVVQVRPEADLPALSLCLRPGLWLLASDPGVMDEALLNLDSDASIADDPVLAKARATFGAGIDAHILLHSSRAQRLLNTWWLPDALDHLDLPAGWAALDLRARPDALLLSGLLVPEGEHSRLEAMQEQGVGRSTAMRALPARVAQLGTQHISDAKAWLTKRGTADDAMADALFGWVQGSIGTAVAPGSDAAADLAWAFFETNDPDLATERLSSLCDGPCDTLNYRGSRLTRLPNGGAHERLLGPAYERVERPWWTVLGELVLFSDNTQALMASIDVWNDGGSLAEDSRTAQWTARMSSDAGSTAWCDLARAWPLLQRGLRSKVGEPSSVPDSLWQQFGGLSLHVSPGQRGFHHLTLGLQHAPHTEAPSALSWSTNVGAAVQSAPQLVRNHVNNTREVLVQDTLHRLHLLASTGQVLWSRQLDGPMLGEAQQVDRFRNGKLQLLLNTAGSLYLIDRNGKDVGGFPVALKSRSSAALAVFDYENERDYRVVVPTSDGQLHNFGLDGQPVKGWEQPKLPSPAATAVVHLRIKGKDHLVVACNDGSLHILDRRGAVRERTSLKITEGPNDVRITPGSELFSSRVLWRDVEGKHWSNDLKGSAAPQVELPRYSTTGDSVIFQDAGVPRTLRTFGSALAKEVVVHSQPRGQTLLVVERPEMGLLSLLDDGGAEIDGSPVKGSWSAAPTDLDLDGRLEWVTVTRDGTVEAHRLPGLRAQTP